MLIHLFMRPAAENSGLVEFPDIDTVCQVFADNFVRAVGVTTRPTRRSTPTPSTPRRP